MVKSPRPPFGVKQRFTQRDSEALISTISWVCKEKEVGLKKHLNWLLEYFLKNYQILSKIIILY